MDSKFLKLIGIILLVNLLSLITLNLRKYQTKHLSIYHMSFLGAFFIFLFSFIVLIYKFNLDKALIIYKKEMNLYLFLSFIAAGFIGIFTWLMWIYLIKTEPMSKFLPMKQGIYILMVFMVGIYFHKENFSLKKMIGLFLILLGIFFMGYDMDFKGNATFS